MRRRASRTGSSGHDGSFHKAVAGAALQRASRCALQCRAADAADDRCGCPAMTRGLPTSSDPRLRRSPSAPIAVELPRAGAAGCWPSAARPGWCSRAGDAAAWSRPHAAAASARAAGAWPALRALHGDAAAGHGAGRRWHSWTPSTQFFNRRIVFRDDSEVWGQVDHWASPLELLDKGRGDCEDYAIAKYFSLLALGMPVAQAAPGLRAGADRRPSGARRRTWCWPTTPQPRAEPLILDNLITERAAGLAPARPGAGVQLQQRRPVAGRRRAERGRPARAAVALARGACQGTGGRIPMNHDAEGDATCQSDPTRSGCCCWAAVLLCVRWQRGGGRRRRLRRATRCRPSCA